ncbi:DUF1707 domain-containing protein [Kribbella sp. NPDC051620]|uniref:DUF1707 domain-containing protein n=1 Tax=Kribbella sp. NPDC051620 TaxID=3364120 RepID=UPI0037B3F6E9
MSGYLPARGSLRIGDAERDRAVEQLSDHFVAGRLTQEEFEERSDQATKARYADEVDLLFADLPELETTHPGRPRRGRSGPPSPLMFVIPVLMIGLVASAVVLAAPWLLWMLFWVAMFSGPARHHRWQQGGRRG